MRKTKDERLIPNSYWVIPGKLLAGEHPGKEGEQETRKRIRWLLEQGIRTWIDLTEEDEARLDPYNYHIILMQEAGKDAVPVIHKRLGIKDFHVPSVSKMREIIAALSEAMGDDHAVYLHCYGGIGRTGTVVGCFLVQQGMTGEQALGRISDLRSRIPTATNTSPETREQWNFIFRWERIKGGRKRDR